MCAPVLAPSLTSCIFQIKSLPPAKSSPLVVEAPPGVTMESEDENISTLLCMGFPDIAEIKRALRLAKNDLNEAVAILTNEQVYELLLVA